MKKYLHYFTAEQQRVQFEGGRDYTEPYVSYVVEDNTAHYNKDYSAEYFTIVSLEDNNTISLYTIMDDGTKTISASTDDGETWTGFTSSTGTNGTTIATLNAGEKVMIKGTNTEYSKSSRNTFKTTKQFDVQGNIMSLTNGDDFKNTEALTETYTFYGLFMQASNLVNAENLALPATTLTDSCYSAMFFGCTSLVSVPALPATIVPDEAYEQMFRGCSGITETPNISATTLGKSSCQYMFSGCTSLAKMHLSPITTLGYNCCSNMFQGCTSLTTAPALPATTLANYCYSYMFYGCTSLTTAPVLPATTLANYCYSYMFYGCTSLTTAPALPAMTLVDYCYNNMFRDCTNLSYIKAMFTTTPSTNYTSSWVNGVASSGTFVKNSAASWTTTGANGVPTGWTVQTASS